MQLAMIGLGKMGSNMTIRLMEGGHQVMVYDRNSESVERSEARGAVGADSLEDLADKLEPPRAAWAMLPAGGPTEQVVDSLGDLFDDDDVVIDGGNSNYRDTMRRAEQLFRDSAGSEKAERSPSKLPSQPVVRP